MDRKRDIAELRAGNVPMTSGLPGSGKQGGDSGPEVAWGEAVARLRLGISLRSRYAAGEAVVFEVLIANEGPEPATLSESYLLVNYDVALERRGGIAVPWSSEGEAARKRARENVWGRAIVILQPGQRLTSATGQLHEWFHLDAPDEYRLRVTRLDWTRKHATPLTVSASFVVAAR